MADRLTEIEALEMSCEDIVALDQRVRDLEAALRWYADAGAYYVGSYGSGGPSRPWIETDRGAIARAALAPAEEPPCGCRFDNDRLVRCPEHARRHANALAAAPAENRENT